MAEADALRLARRKFLAAQRIDMTSLAAELGSIGSRCSAG
jgi:hypothetical protein